MIGCLAFPLAIRWVGHQFYEQEVVHLNASKFSVLPDGNLSTCLNLQDTQGGDVFFFHGRDKIDL